mmetsp:Transcript_88323/g.263428  ORF Transcript_88323/g.263428 Transcript_88323/m.263428 type:complete len:243 (+) Transcript_88323:861-1589(+)
MMGAVHSRHSRRVGHPRARESRRSSPGRARGSCPPRSLSRSSGCTTRKTRSPSPSRAPTRTMTGSTGRQRAGTSRLRSRAALRGSPAAGRTPPETATERRGLCRTMRIPRGGAASPGACERSGLPETRPGPRAWRVLHERSALHSDALQCEFCAFIWVVLVCMHAHACESSRGGPTVRHGGASIHFSGRVHVRDVQARLTFSCGPGESPPFPVVLLLLVDTWHSFCGDFVTRGEAPSRCRGA